MPLATRVACRHLSYRPGQGAAVVEGNDVQGIGVQGIGVEDSR